MADMAQLADMAAFLVGALCVAASKLFRSSDEEWDADCR
jgi:hypothetical protein